MGILWPRFFYWTTAPFSSVEFPAVYFTMLRFPVQGNSIVTHLSKQSSSRQNLLVSTLNSKMVQIVHFVSCCGPTTRKWSTCQSLLRPNDYGANFVTAFKVRIRQSDQLFFFMWYLIPLHIWLLKVLWPICYFLKLMKWNQTHNQKSFTHTHIMNTFTHLLRYTITVKYGTLCAICTAGVRLHFFLKNIIRYTCIYYGYMLDACLKKLG